MGCDYYIDKHLWIYDNDNIVITSICLAHDRGYFYDNDDDDDSEKSIQEQLKPSMKPMLIYENNVFCKPAFESKYKSLVLQHLPKDKTWEDISKIVKRESRYERD